MAPTPQLAGKLCKRMKTKQKNILCCVKEGDEVKSVTTTPFEVFQMFLNHTSINALKWNGKGKFKTVLYLEKYPDVENILVIRIQTNSGLCYMHGPVALEHIKVVIYNYLTNNATKDDFGMTDMGACWLKKVLQKGDTFTNWVNGEQNGDSREFLRGLLNIDSHDKTSLDEITIQKVSKRYTELEQKNICKELMDLLAVQPALVSSFKVYDDFFHGKQDGVDSACFHGDPTTIPGHVLKGLHSMLLVGIAYDPDTDEYLLLLENWWLGRHFTQVTPEYFAACGGIITFVTVDVKKLADGYPAKLGSVVESACDQSDGPMLEMAAGLYGAETCSKY